MYRGFAKLYRKFLEWEWYEDIPCKVLYVHCLLKASHKDRKYRGKEIPRGSFVTGRDDLSRGTGLSNQQVRTALGKLAPSYITITATNKGTHIFVVDFDTYNGELSPINQQINQPGNQQSTSNQPATHHTSNQPSTTNKNVKNEKHLKNDKKEPAPKKYLVANSIDWINQDIWEEWIDHKRKVKASVGARALKKNVNDLELLGAHNANAIIEQSIDEGWKGLFALKVKNTSNDQLSASARASIEFDTRGK